MHNRIGTLGLLRKEVPCYVAVPMSLWIVDLKTTHIVHIHNIHNSVHNATGSVGVRVKGFNKGDFIHMCR